MVSLTIDVFTVNAEHDCVTFVGLHNTYTTVYSYGFNNINLVSIYVGLIPNIYVDVSEN